MAFSNLPIVSEYLSKSISKELSQKFGTKVSIQNMHVDLLGRLELYNTSILDQKNDSLIHSIHIRARLKLFDLLNHQIVVNHLDLFDTHCRFYKTNDDAKANYQFLIDSLSSNKNPKGTKMDFLLKTFIVRNLNVKYDNLSKVPTNRLFNIYHLDFKNINGNFGINKIAKDSLNIRIRNLQLQEKSGLIIDHLAFNLIAGQKKTEIKNFKLIMPHSFFEMSNLEAINEVRNKKLDFLHNSFSQLNVKAKLFLPEFGVFYSPLKKTDNSAIYLVANINKNKGIVHVSSYMSKYDSEQFLLRAHTDINLYRLIQNKQLILSSDISNFQIQTGQLKSLIALFSPKTKLPESIDKIGKINHQGLIIVRPNRIALYGNTACNIGSLREHLELFGKHLSAKIETHNLDLRSFLDKKLILGPINSQLEVSGNLSKPLKLNMTSTINNIKLNNYEYKNIQLIGIYSKSNFDASLKVLDNNLNTHIQAKYNFSNIGDKLTASINIIHFNPEALHLIKDYPNNTVSGQVFIKLNEFSPTSAGIVEIHNFNMKDNDKTYGFDSLVLTSSKIQNKIHTTILSDLLDAHINSNVSMKDLPHYFYNFLMKQVHVLPIFFQDKVIEKNKYAYFDINFKRTDLLEHLMKMSLRFQQMPNFSGFFNTTTNEIQLTAFFPSFSLNGSSYKNGSLFLTNQGDSLSLLGQITKTFNQNDVKFVLNADAYNNSILSQIEWKMLSEHGTLGFIKSKILFRKDANGVENTSIQIFPSIIHINDSIWTVNPSLVNLKKDNYQIYNFMISHVNQYITLNNTPDSIANGKGLLAKLNEIDLAYVFDILNFHPVEFDGKASGFFKTNDLSENKDIKAQLTVNNFKFNTGDMGTLLLDGKWDNTNKIIHLDAKAQQTKEDSTSIKGFVNIGGNQINLNFTSVKTNLEFLNQYFSSFISNLSGQCSGNMRLFGPLNAINLEGQEKIDALGFRPKVLNVTYHITNDSIILRPGKFIFDNVTLKDEKGNSAKVNGEISHRVLHDFKYDLKIDAQNLLAYDWKEHETNTFWGTVYSDGNCRLWGSTDAVHVDMDMTPNKNTTFVYDSSNPVENDKKEYIHFTKTNPNIQTTENQLTSNHEHENGEKDSSTDTYLNFKINTNPNANLIVLTDRKTGDNISLTGSGPLNINYYNKGKFSIFGNYLINDGLYKITVRDVIHKNFQMQQGGTIRFNGSPMDGDLNMKGIYTINSVSLADLNLGNLQNTTANVDCILYFKGKCASPEVSFDLDFSNVNDEEKQMVRNMIASQGDMNMQIIYLLSIGRFFTYDYSNYNTGRTQNQSSVAMKSLLASTLSEQFNTMLSNALHINNWKFGTNISTGRVGWSDMEVEGLLSGSLLNNRVLINGNFGYRDQSYYTNNFVGDFNIRWLLTKSGVISLKAYSETNDRYFTKTSLTTNGAGILFQRDFNSLKELFGLIKKN